MIRSHTATVLASALLLTLGGTANAGSIQPSIAFAGPGPAADSLNEAGVSADNYQASFGVSYSGGQFTGGYQESTSSCGGGSFSYFSCTVMKLNVRDVIDEIFSGSYTFSSHTHGGFCGHTYRPPSSKVPEPSAAAVFALGALIVGSRSRRR